MALNVGELYAKLKLDLTDFNKGIKDVQKQLTAIGNNKAFDVFSTKAVNALTKIGNMQARIYKQMNDNLKLKTQLALANMSREEAAEQRKHNLKMAQIQKEIILKAQQTQLAISLIRRETDTFKAESTRKAQADRNLTQERIANIRAWERISVASMRSFQNQATTTNRLIANQERNRINEQRRAENQAYRQRMDELRQMGAVVGAGYFTGALQGNIFQQLFNTFSVSSVIGALQLIFTTTLNGLQTVGNQLYQVTSDAIAYNASLEMSYEQIKFLIGGQMWDDARAGAESLGQSLDDVYVPLYKITEQSGKLYGELKKIALESPTLTFEGVMQGATRLINAGVPIKEVTRVVKALGDGSATTGADAVRNFDRVTYAVGQMYQKGGIYAEEFRKQLGNTGIPTIKALAAITGKTVEEISKSMDDGKLKSREWVDTYIKGLEKIRGGSMNIIADTFTGQVNLLMENWKFFAAEVTKPLFNTLKGELAELQFQFDKVIGSEAFAGLRNFFNQFSIVLSAVSSQILPVLLEQTKQFLTYLTDSAKDWTFYFLIEKDDEGLNRIEAFFKDLPTWIDNALSLLTTMWNVFTGIIDLGITLANVFLGVGMIFDKIKATFEFWNWAEATAWSTTLTEKIEGLVEIFLILTSVMVALKVAFAVASVIFFIKNINIAAAVTAQLTKASQSLAITNQFAQAEIMATAAQQAKASALNMQSSAAEARARALNAKILGQETLAKQLNRVATQMDTQAKTLNATATTLAAEAGVTHAAAVKAQTAAMAAAVPAARTFWSVILGPIGIITTVLGVLAVAITSMVDFGDVSVESGEDAKKSWEKAEEQLKQTKQLLDEGFVSKTVDINVISNVKDIDFSSLPQYNADGTIQGPDMVVRVIKIEDVGGVIKEDAKKLKDEEIKKAEKKLAEYQKKAKELGKKSDALAAGIDSAPNNIAADMYRTEKAKVDAELAAVMKQVNAAGDWIRKIKNDPGVALYSTAEKKAIEASKKTAMGKALAEVKKAGLIDDKLYNSILIDMNVSASKGQEALELIVQQRLEESQKAIKAKEKFATGMYPVKKPGYEKSQNMGKTIAELRKEGLLPDTGGYTDLYDKVLKGAMYGYNEWLLLDMLPTKKAREAFIKKVKEWKKDAFDKSKGKGSYGAGGGSPDTTPEDSPDFTGGGTKPLSPYEKLKRTAEHLKSMGKSAKEVYNKWKEAQAVAYKEVDADQGLANFRESQEKMLDILNDAEKEKTKAIEDWQKEQEKALEKSYKNRKDQLDKYYRDIDDKEDVAKLKEERRKLEIERTFYEGATSAEGISKLAEIDSKLRDNLKAIEKKNRDITKQNEEDALEAGKEATESEISKYTNKKIGQLDDSPKTSTAYIDWVNLVTKNVKDKNLSEVSDFQKKFTWDEATGTFIDKSKVVKGPIKPPDTVTSTTTSTTNTGSYEWLQAQGIIGTYKMPEMPKATEAKTAYAGGSYGFANPMGQLVAAGGTVNNFNGALVNVNTMYVRDDQDVTNIGKEMFRTAQRAATAQGGRL